MYSIFTEHLMQVVVASVASEQWHVKTLSADWSRNV
jgi:hypothetical protein